MGHCKNQTSNSGVYKVIAWFNLRRFIVTLLVTLAAVWFIADLALTLGQLIDMSRYVPFFVPIILFLAAYALDAALKDIDKKTLAEQRNKVVHMFNFKLEPEFFEDTTQLDYGNYEDRPDSKPEDWRCLEPAKPEPDKK